MEFAAESIAIELEERELVREWNYNEDLKTQYFVFHNPLSKEQLNLLTEKYLFDIESILSNFPEWEEGYLGTIQFFTLLMILQKSKERTTTVDKSSFI